MTTSAVACGTVEAMTATRKLRDLIPHDTIVCPADGREERVTAVATGGRGTVRVRTVRHDHIRLGTETVEVVSGPIFPPPSDEAMTDTRPDAKPVPGTVLDYLGRPCPQASTASYPLFASCSCGNILRCADSTADWSHDITGRKDCW
jgi:hypothetical protein